MPIEGPHKVLVIGEPGIGKTSLIRRYVDGIFDKHYCATLGVDFALKIVPWEGGKNIRLQLWDIAGQERFSSMTRVYYKQATACVIIFDITRKSTFQEVEKWKADLDEKARLPSGDLLPCLLVANKCDLKDRPVSEDDIDSMCQEQGFIGWIETSAKEDVNVEKAMVYLIKHILALDDEGYEPPSQNSLVVTADGKKAGKPCCPS
mmetsp:Transcript_8901/g.22954  ORF Transcript_8901/g.22954 Transcript_8901/m.22954 type:complete len:205 (+) Transcript_8901:172-786(+)